MSPKESRTHRRFAVPHRLSASKRRRRQTLRRSAILVGLIGALLLLLLPSISAAVPLTTQQQFDNVWTSARDVGQYRFSASALQTAIPVPNLSNVGKNPETHVVNANGLVNMPEEQLSLTLQTDNGPLEIQMMDGSAFGRTGNNQQWIELEDPDLVFAPNNDLMAFSQAAENVTLIEDWQTSVELDEVTSLRVTGATSMFVFDISGPKFAEYMRDQAEAELRHNGELHYSMQLELSAQFLDMTGSGRLWVNADGLPLYQELTLNFPPERSDLARIEADIITEFRGWELAALDNKIAYLIPRLINDPSLLITDPASLVPRFSLSTPNAIAIQQGIAYVGLILIFGSVVLLLVLNRRSKGVYTGVAVSMTVAMLAGPLLPLFDARRVSAYAAIHDARRADQEAEAAEE
ncbi:MAG: hypothetical protein AAF633_26315, partial [Chloroflexota bacterium]